MYKIVCDYCGEEIIFEEASQKPETCPNCNSFFDKIKPQKVFESTESRTEDQIKNTEQQLCTGLTLVYQKTGDIIHVDQTKATLGREAFGADVLGDIAQISRKHCVVEFIDNQYKVTDLGSFNGTFAGTLKINCRENPQQVLNNNDLIFLGQEPFLVQLHFEDQPSMAAGDVSTRHDDKIIDDTQPDQRRSVIYRCKNCGKDYKYKKDICEECGTFSEWEEIEV